MGERGGWDQDGREDHEPGIELESPGAQPVSESAQYGRGVANSERIFLKKDFGCI